MILQYEPVYGYLEKKMINAYMENPGWITEFKETAEFEKRIADFLGVQYCSTTNNGTISLSLALLAIGVKPGDLVAVPDLTMYATATAVTLIGAIPIFVDVHYATLLMNLDKLEDLLFDYEIKAVIYVSLNGRWDTTGKLIQLQDQYSNVGFIEDAAQAFGSNCYRGKIGTSLQISSFSFSTPKIITTGQGGCLVTNDDSLALAIRKLKDFGRVSGGTDTHDSFGINSKFTELQAVIGLAQLEQIQYRLLRKRQMYELYSTYLAGIPQVAMVGIDEFTVPWFMDVRVEDRELLIPFLKEKEIGTRSMYPPLHAQSIYQQQPKESFGITEQVSQEILWLPSSFSLSDSDIEYICKSIGEFYEI
jgi:perosamine synthetase